MKDYIVFTIGSNKQTAKDFAKFWNCPLGKIVVKKFADGETLAKIQTSVKDKDVILIESMAKKPNERLIEILQILDSIHRDEPRSVTLLIPYLAYSRQDRVSSAYEPVSCEVIAKAIESAHYDKLMVLDLHSPSIERFFTRGIKNIPTSELFINYYSNYFRENNLSFNDAVVISPDRGSNYRADSLLFAFRGAKKVVCEKNRPQPDKAEHLKIDGDVRGKICIIIDDIISTGNTIASAAKLLYENGAKEVLVGATHGVFSEDALKKMLTAGVRDIVVTNTIEQKLEGVNVLDIFQLLIQYS